MESAHFGSARSRFFVPLQRSSHEESAEKSRGRCDGGQIEGRFLGTYLAPKYPERAENEETPETEAHVKALISGVFELRR